MKDSKKCQKTWMGKSCVYANGHLGPCLYNAG